MSFLSFLGSNARWLGAAFLLTAFSGFGQTFFISLSAGDLRAAFGLSHGELGSLYMLATLGSALTLPTLGRTLDRFSVLQVAAAVILTLAGFCLAMALVPNAIVLVIVIYGLRLFGQGMMLNTAMTATGRWFEAQRGRAVSVVGLGYPVSEALLPITFVTISALVGWRQTWGLAALVLVFAVLPLVLQLLSKERVPKGQDLGRSSTARRNWNRAEVLKDPLFYVVTAGVLAPPFIATAILFHQVYLTELRGWPKELFALAFMVMSATAVISSLVLGGLIDRFTARALLPFMLVPLTAGCVVLALVHQPAGVYLFMALLGLSNGFVATFIGALWPELYGTAHLGAIRSVVFAVMVFASALGPGLTGWLIDLGVPFDLQILGMGLYCLAMIGALTAAARTLKRR
ncbi:MFS transporter [Pannonibacter sp.]|uniref:MFS transporter n=1 Tax=Pannonibacter sp. TaxID=1906786 RepID=UPI003F6EB758